MTIKAITRAQASALLFGGAAVCSIALTARAQTNATIRLAIVPVEGASEPFYAKDMGFFAKAGIDADIQSMHNIGAIAAAVTSNAVDIGFTTVDVLAITHQKQIPLVVVAPANEYLSPTTEHIAAIVLPANSSVQLARDLNRKTIAVPGLHGFAEISTRVWIDQHGGDSSTVKFVEVPIPATSAALDEGRVDGAYIGDPFLEVAKKNNRVLAYGADGIAKHFLFGAWITTPQWAKDHQDLVRRFAGVMHDAAIWANANAGASAAILAKYTQIDPTVIATMTRAHYSDQLSASLMQPVVEATAKYNAFNTFPAQQLIYTPSR